MAVDRGGSGGHKVPLVDPRTDAKLGRAPALPSHVLGLGNRGQAVDALRLSLQAQQAGKLDVGDSLLLQAALTGGAISPDALIAPTLPSPPTQAGGGGGGSHPVLPQGPTIADILSKLVFPSQASLPPYLRDFGRYVEDLLTQQAGLAIPVPKIEGGQLVTEGSAVQTLEVPQDVEAYSAMWGTFLDMVKSANLHLQQQLLGLRYSPATGFYLSGQQPQLPNLEHL